jgi:hypothetical protein
MDFKLPYILFIFNEQGLDTMVSIEILALTLPEESFLPDIISGGRKLELRIQLPDMFADEERIIASNDGVLAGFNENTHKAQAFARCIWKLGALPLWESPQFFKDRTSTKKMINCRRLVGTTLVVN